MGEHKEILNLKEASLFLNISMSKIRNLIHENEIPYHMIGNRYYFSSTNLAIWIAHKSKNIDLLNYNIKERKMIK